jgi:hypothetical protein
MEVAWQVGSVRMRMINIILALVQTKLGNHRFAQITVRMVSDVTLRLGPRR